MKGSDLVRIIDEMQHLKNIDREIIFAGIESAHIEGESMGGWVAVSLALKHPERVRKLVLNTIAGLNNRKPGEVPEQAPGFWPGADGSARMLADSATRERVTGYAQMVMIEPRHPNRAGLDRALRVVLG